MKPARIEAFFFDMDGTIVDTEPAAQGVLREFLLKESGSDPQKVKLIEQCCDLVIGQKIDISLKFALTHQLTHLTDFNELKTKISDLYFDLLRNEIVTVPGCVPFIQEISENYPLALVSGSSKAEIMRILDRLGITACFDVILGAEDYPFSKPHPCGYEMAIEALGVEPTNCILFEDSTPGIASGVEAKLRVFAIEMANHTYQDQSQAEDRIKDFTGVTAETFENWIKNKK